MVILSGQLKSDSHIQQTVYSPGSLESIHLRAWTGHWKRNYSYKLYIIWVYTWNTPGT